MPVLLNDEEYAELMHAQTIIKQMSKEESGKDKTPSRRQKKNRKKRKRRKRKKRKDKPNHQDPTTHNSQRSSASAKYRALKRRHTTTTSVSPNAYFTTPQGDEQYFNYSHQYYGQSPEVMMDPAFYQTVSRNQQQYATDEEEEDSELSDEMRRRRARRQFLTNRGRAATFDYGRSYHSGLLTSEEYNITPPNMFSYVSDRSDSGENGIQKKSVTFTDSHVTPSKRDAGGQLHSPPVAPRAQPVLDSRAIHSVRSLPPAKAFKRIRELHASQSKDNLTTSAENLLKELIIVHRRDAFMRKSTILECQKKQRLLKRLESETNLEKKRLGVEQLAAEVEKQKEKTRSYIQKRVNRIRANRSAGNIMDMIGYE